MVVPFFPFDIEPRSAAIRRRHLLQNAAASHHTAQPFMTQMYTSAFPRKMAL